MRIEPRCGIEAQGWLKATHMEGLAQWGSSTVQVDHADNPAVSMFELVACQKERDPPAKPEGSKAMPTEIPKYSTGWRLNSKLA